jgi:hypothetical protein
VYAHNQSRHFTFMQAKVVRQPTHYCINYAVAGPSIGPALKAYGDAKSLSC